MKTNLEEREKELWCKLEVANFLLHDAAEDFCRAGRYGCDIKALKTLKKRIENFVRWLIEWGTVKTELEMKKEETAKKELRT